MDIIKNQKNHHEFSFVLSGKSVQKKNATKQNLLVAIDLFPEFWY